MNCIKRKVPDITKDFELYLIYNRSRWILHAFRRPMLGANKKLELLNLQDFKEIRRASGSCLPITSEHIIFF